MKIHLVTIFWLTIFSSQLYSQSNPISLRPDVTVSALIAAPNFSSGIAVDPVSGKLHYTGLNGSVYQMNYPGLPPITDTLLYTTADHGILLLKGLMFKDSTLFLIGNNNIDTTLTTGIIQKGVLQSNGTRVWSNVMETEPYQLGNGFFDHGMSGLCLNPAGDSIYFNSGSRTDHGEEQENSGLYPGLREVPITSAIFRIPANSSGLVFMNDTAFLSSYIYADGIRNTFKMAFNANQHLFGCENSGDRDDPDELNYLMEGNHYGFPWNMGGNDNPQQFPSYDPQTDLLLNPLRQSVQNGIFYNDPGFPGIPTPLLFTSSVQNSGPHSDKYRSALTGVLYDASDGGSTLGTFTSHSSPLGLVFDNDSLLIPSLSGHGFLFNNQKGGDSLGNVAGGGFGTLLDPGENMLDVNFIYDATLGTYSIECTDVILGFTRPVDACMLGTKIYLLEYGTPALPGTIYEINLPPFSSGISEPNTIDVRLECYPNPVTDQLIVTTKAESLFETELELYNMFGQKLNHDEIKIDSNGGAKINCRDLKSGIYFLKSKNTGLNTLRFTKL